MLNRFGNIIRMNNNERSTDNKDGKKEEEREMEHNMVTVNRSNKIEKREKTK